MTEPERQPLSDADLIAWSVVLTHRAQQEHDGINMLVLPYPPCPTCGEAVHEAEQATYDRITKTDIHLTVRPCGHVHTTSDEDMHRLWLYIHEMVRDVASGYHGYAVEARKWTTEEIVREARARATGTATDGGSYPPPDRQPSAEEAVRPGCDRDAQFQRAEQLEELLRVAHETSNRSEAERARAVERAERAEATVDRVRAESARIRAATRTWEPVADRIDAALAGSRSEPRLLDCGFCYEEQGEEVHPHPECPVARAALPVVEFTGAETLALKGPKSARRLVLTGDEQSRCAINGHRYAPSTEHPVVVEPFGPGVAGGLVTLTLIAEAILINGKEAADA
jgi:predicted nucleic acid-binding Zn ribbon protein